MRRPESLPSALAEIAERHPDRVPFRSDVGVELTYREWAVRAAHLATFLREDRGAGPGIELRLAFEWSDWHHYPIAYMAALATGATVVTARVDATEEGSAGPRARESSVILRLPGERGLAVVSDGDLVFREELPVPDWPVFAQPKANRPDAVAEVLHTSGTTGPRRAVACTYADLTSMLLRDAVAPMSVAVEPSILVHHVPLGSQAAQRILVESVRSHWQTSICVAHPMGADLIRAMAGNHATFVGLVPTTARRVIHEAGRTGQVLPTVRWVTVGSEHVAPRIFEQLASIFPDAQLLSTFGATEAGAARIRCEHGECPGSIGRPEPGCGAEIRDSQGRILPANEIGDLWLTRFGAPPRFYVDDIEANRVTFRDGWVRTGDVARLDRDGFVHLVDRSDDIVSSGGETFGTFEVEDCLASHPLVFAAAVVGVQTPLLGERVVAAVVLTPSDADRAVARRELLAHCRGILPTSRVPTRFVFLPELPVAPSGKVQKRAIRAAVAEGDAGALAP